MTYPYSTVNPLSIVDGVRCYTDKGGTERLPAASIRSVQFRDADGTQRVFTDVGKGSLHERIYGGKLNWYRSYREHGYDRSAVTTDYFITEQGDTVTVGVFGSFEKVFRSVIASRPDLVQAYAAIRYPKDSDRVEILRRYEH